MLKLKKLWQWIQFGKITSEVKSVDGGHVSEVAYYGRNGVLVGYWAYGSFDPSYPYRGERDAC